MSTKKKTMSANFEEEREVARQEAIEWQADFSNHNYSWGELANWQEHFRELGEKYNLTEEFQENGII